MITLEEYFGPKSHTAAQADAADDLLARVNALILESGMRLAIDADTGTQISGVKGGSGSGGFRLAMEAGAPKSAHKEARAVDVFDPFGALDRWITDEVLEKHGLWREDPPYTPSWVHLQTRPATRRTFEP